MVEAKEEYADSLTQKFIEMLAEVAQLKTQVSQNSAMATEISELKQTVDSLQSYLDEVDTM